MSKIEQKESTQVEMEEPVNGFHQVSGLGALLKKEREKKGFSQEQIVDVTRLRKHYVEALENEDWGELPPPVFVRGFIKSYAQVLGLNEKETLELYDRITPVSTSPPRPLEKPAKAKKRRFPLVIVVLVLVAAAIYILTGYPPRGKDSLKPEEESVTETTQQDQQIVAKGVEPEPTEKPSDMGGEGESVESKPEVDEKPVVAQPPEETVSGQPGPPKKEEKPEGETPLEEKPGTPTVEEAAAINQTPELVLTGIVKERTWLRICVDDQDPKEYIFQPGSRPQWKGKDGFNVLIGNAAGIDFDFNGNKLGDLGEAGKVVRLRLPENFAGTKCEE